jgi:hypothetical protein
LADAILRRAFCNDQARAEKSIKYNKIKCPEHSLL